MISGGRFAAGDGRRRRGLEEKGSQEEREGLEGREGREEKIIKGEDGKGGFTKCFGWGLTEDCAGSVDFQNDRRINFGAPASKFSPFSIDKAYAGTA